MTTSRLPASRLAALALLMTLTLAGCAASWGPPRALVLLTGSGPQVYTCRGGQQFSVGVTREPDGSIEVRFYVEPGRRLAATIGPYTVTLHLPSPQTMTRGELEARYPEPCDYLDELARPAA